MVQNTKVGAPETNQPTNQFSVPENNNQPTTDGVKLSKKLYFRCVFNRNIELIFYTRYFIHSRINNVECTLIQTMNNIKTFSLTLKFRYYRQSLHV